MPHKIEDYGLIGNLVSCALVGRNGSIDWLCLPRFDSDACFAALIGTAENGHWLIAPDEQVRSLSRRYLPGTAILETRFETGGGAVTVTDFMPVSGDARRVELVRLVRGVQGTVRLRLEFVLRFGNGRILPWVRRRDYGLRAVAGPDAIDLTTPIALHGDETKIDAVFDVVAGETAPFTLAYHASTDEPRFVDDRDVLLKQTELWWRTWSDRCRLPPGAPSEWKQAVKRSLITLKTLTFAPTGGLVAAPTTSLPERIGGLRNWDYRYCWIRDSALTMYALLNSGCFDEADAFRKWLLRAAAGHPSQLQTLYGVGGERRLTEIELAWLAGYENSRPVRIGNAAHEQFQLDIHGELMDVLHVARRSGLDCDETIWHLQTALLKNLGTLWREPDNSIWEVRDGRRHFTFSKIMAWVAFDRGVKTVEQFGLEGPIERWRAARDEIRRDILANGYDSVRNTFVRYYGGRTLDAALLLTAQLGFVAHDDPRFQGTVEAIERELIEHGFVRRYCPEPGEYAADKKEGTFLACSFWLADAYVFLNRTDEAAALFERLLSVRNDLGLLAEEYDPRAGRQLGNFPQAFSHVALVNAAHNLLRDGGPAHQRAERGEPPRSERTPDLAISASPPGRA
jgi:GH15 family glucan-1,4-alpha-glucosidase